MTCNVKSPFPSLPFPAASEEDILKGKQSIRSQALGNQNSESETLLDGDDDTLSSLEEKDLENLTGTETAHPLHLSVTHIPAMLLSQNKDKFSLCFHLNILHIHSFAALNTEFMLCTGLHISYHMISPFSPYDVAVLLWYHSLFFYLVASIMCKENCLLKKALSCIIPLDNSFIMAAELLLKTQYFHVAVCHCSSASQTHTQAWAATL